MFARQYVQYLPPYERYPVHATFDGSHLTSYEFDLALLDELDRAGERVFYVFDMWDWAWNVYAPFGRYAASYRAGQAVLDARFLPVVRIFTRDRGWIVLYRYGRPPGAPTSGAAVFVEGRAVSLDPEVPPRATAETGGKIIPAEPARVGQWDLEPAAEYWLHADVAVFSGLVVPVWNGRSLSRFLDASVPVPIDLIVRGDQGTLSLVPYPPSTAMRIESLSLRRVRPR